MADGPQLQEALDSVLAEVARQVEVEVHRSFVEVPEVELVEREKLIEAEVAARSVLPRMRGEKIDLVAVRAASTERVAGLVAQYSSYERKIFVVREAADSLFDEWKLPHASTPALARCILAHELTHAAQDQFSGAFHGATGDPALRELLIEGQAQLVEDRLCKDPLTHAILAATQGVDVLSSQPEDPAKVPFIYGYGRRYAAAVEGQQGMEGLWAALDRAPPTRDEVVAVARVGLERGWSDLALTGDAGRALLDVSGWEVIEEAHSPIDLLSTLDDVPLGEGGIPRGVAGQWTVMRHAEQQVVVAAFLLEEPEWARGWLERRATLGRSKRVLGGALTEPLRAKGTGALRGVDAAVRLVSKDPYQEWWGLRGGRLVGVIAYETSLPPSHLAAAVLSVLDAPIPASVEESQPVDLSRYAPPDPLPAPSVHWGYPLVKAMLAIDRGNPSACVDAARQSLALSDARGREAAALMGFGCGLAAHDPDRAKPFFEAAPHTLFPPDSRLEYARQLVVLERSAEVLPIVEGMAFEDEGHRMMLFDLRVLGHLARKEFDLALAIARTEPLGGPILQTLAVAAFAKAKYSVVFELLQGKCASMPQELRGDCAKLVEMTRP